MPRWKPGPSFSKPAAPRINCILDSGAYSAWRLGKHIDIKEYCDYLHRNEAWIGPYICLDKIDPSNPEEAARQSLVNLKYMRREGLNPMPVYHVGEDISWLFRMLDLGCDYIGIGALSMRGSDRADNFYSYVWSHLVNSRGLPIVKVHGLGEGRAGPLKRYPWFSADSTSWIYAAQRNGRAVMPDGKMISMRHDGSGSDTMPHIENLGVEERAAFDDVMHRYNIDTRAFNNRDEVSTMLRTYLAAIYYKELEADIRAMQPIKFKPSGFFQGALTQSNQVVDEPFNLHLVCGNNYLGWTCLAKLGYPRALASYYYVSGGGKANMYKSLEEWVRRPTHFARTDPSCSRYWNILEENLT